MRVENMTSPRTGREVPNQFIIRGQEEITFQSYSTPICTLSGDVLTVNKGAWFSATTKRYLKRFLEEYTDIKIVGSVWDSLTKSPRVRMVEEL